MQVGLEVWTQNFIYKMSGTREIVNCWHKRFLAVFLSSKSLKSESIFFEVEFIRGCFNVCINYCKWNYVFQNLFIINHYKFFLSKYHLNDQFCLYLSVSLSSKPPSPLSVILWPHTEGGLEQYKVTDNALTISQFVTN